MKNQIKTLTVLICLSLTTNAQRKWINPYDTLKYDKVVAYDFNGREGRKLVVDNRVNKKLVTKEEDLLPEQVKFIHKVLGDKKTYGGETAACFDPHLGLVYFRNDRIVGQISICLDCNYLQSSMEIPVSKLKTKKVADDASVPLIGFSDQGRKQINDFCKQLKFSHCKDTLRGFMEH